MFKVFSWLSPVRYTACLVHNALSSGFLKTEVHQDARLRAQVASQTQSCISTAISQGEQELNHQPGLPLGYT